MQQFYFLSILLNLVTGLILVYGKNLLIADSEQVQSKARNILGDNAFFDDKTFRLILAILTAFVGIMKFLSVTKTDIPVVGDLFPALCGLFGGFCLLIEYYKISSTSNIALPHFINLVFIEKRKYIGYTCIAISILHFIFPTVLFL